MLYPEPESRALAMALAELRIVKRSREEDDEEFLKGLDYQKAGLKGKAPGEFRKLPAPVRGEMIALSIRQAREDEPKPVTERLRPLRLIEQMHEEGDLRAETVDAIIAEGQAIGPLLVGVMRDFDALLRHPADFEGESNESPT
jgi:hypothetical protein